MSSAFPKTEESLRNLYHFIVFYKQFICILNAVLSAEEKYYPNSNIESDYIWLVTKIEQIVKDKEFEYFASLNDFNKLATSLFSYEGKMNLKKFNFLKEVKLYKLYKPLIPLYSLDILNDEIKRAGFINYLLNKTGATLINHIEQFYDRIYLENNKKSYQLKEEEQRILIESNWHILEYAEQITTIKQKRLEEKISELEAIQTEQSLENLFQSSFRLIEEFIEDINLKNIVTNDLQQAKLCYQKHAYKATVLLCGGIIEAILKEAITSKNSNRPVEREFLAVINRAEQEGIIKQITADLSHVTRVYRNTTHIDTQKTIGLIEESDAYIAIKTLKNVCDNVIDWYKITKSCRNPI
ncbi:hypothetical protein JYQ62_00560 [Nostoc sp. UHCC 0702]|nr:hypothetical protein JYQ62_00560 [Nostoc sp. UHCC 0702]